MNTKTIKIYECRLAQRTLKTLLFSFAVPIAMFSASSFSYVYQCDKSDTKCVINHNKDVKKNLGVKNVKIFRVTMPKSQTTDMGDIKSNVRALDNFFNTASRNQLNLKLESAQTVEVARGSCQNVQNQALKETNPSGFLNVYVLPLEACDYSHAGGKNIYLDGGGLFRDYAHETGHTIGLGHGNRNINGFEEYGDASTYMGKFPSDNYSIPQLHFLGWTQKHEVVKINADIDSGGVIEVPLRPVDKNVESDSTIPLAYVYEMEDSRTFIGIPKSHDSNSNSINGGEIFIYHTTKCKDGCGDTVKGRIFDIKKAIANGKEYNFEGLTIKPIGYESEKITQNGKKIDKFKEITLRISKSP